MIDAHCHLSAEGMASAPGPLLAEAAEAGVHHVVMAGTDPACWARQAHIAARHPHVTTVYGVHPWWAARYEDEELDHALEALATCLSGDGKPGAIGETGLDRARSEYKVGFAQQERSFRAHLSLAKAAALPVVLHVVRAHGRALDILDEEGPLRAGGVVHGFGGSPELVPRYLAHGLHLSFSGLITRHSARRARAAAAATPDESLLVETDAPDQAPAPHGSEPGRPSQLPLVVKELARIRGASASDVAAVTERNARDLFRL